MFTITRIGKTSAQLVRFDSGVEVLISYETPVACRIPAAGGDLIFVTDKKWSATTTKQVNRAYPIGTRTRTKPQEFFYKLMETCGARINLDSL